MAKAKVAVRKIERTPAPANDLSDTVRATAGQAARAMRTNEELDKKLKKNAKRLEALVVNFEQHGSKTRRVGIDLGGGIVAQGFTELLNYGVRAAADYSKDGFWAKQVDMMQSIPHMVMGTLTYLAEILTRDHTVLPNWKRELVSEASKIFSQLGFANLTRAIRVRSNLTKAAAGDADATAKERDAVAKERDDLKAMYNKLLAERKTLK